MFSDTLCFRTPPIFHGNNEFLDAQKHVFRTNEHFMVLVSRLIGLLMGTWCIQILIWNITHTFQQLTS